MNDKKPMQPVIVVAASLALLAGLWLGYLTGPKKPATAPEIYGTLLPTAKPLAAFHLLGRNNQAFSEQNLRGSWSLIFIGYTHCPDICPTTLTTLQQTIELMQEKDIAIPQVIFISIDPARDTPEVLEKYITYFNKDFIGLTGNESELMNISKQLSVYYKKAAGASGDSSKNDYLMDHSAAIMLINPEAELQAFLTAPHIPAQIIESVQRSMNYYNDIQ